MAKTESVCSCGAAYNSEGVCTRCGKKRPHGSGYRVFHGILCVIAALLLLLCITSTAFVRHQLKYRRITKALKNDTRISDVSAPFSKKTVADRIREEYVTDDAVTTDDVASSVDCMEVPAFAAGKLEQFAEMLRGNTDKIVKVQPDEIIQLLESHESELYQRSMIVIDDADKEDIRSSVSGPLGTLNSTLDTCYGSPALRALARFRASGWRILLDLALMGLLLWRWAVVRRNSGKSAVSAFRGMGFTVLIPSALVFIGCVITGLISAFAKDGKVGLLALGKAVRMPLWLSSMLGISVGALLLIIYLAALNAKLKKELQPASAQPARWTGTKMQPVEVPDSTAGQKYCIRCGKLIPETAGFCIYCGMNQSGVKASETPETAPETAETPAEVPENAGTPDAADTPETPEA